MPSETIEYFVSYYCGGDLHCRCSIGLMTTEEAVFFMSNSSILEISSVQSGLGISYTVEGKYRIPLDTDDDKVAHAKLLAHFEEDYDAYISELEEHAASSERLENDQVSTEIEFEHVIKMKGVQEYADKVREIFCPKVHTGNEAHPLLGSTGILVNATSRIKSTSNQKQSKKTQQKSEGAYQSIYDVEVKKYLDNLEQKRAKGILNPKELKKQRGVKYIAERLQKLDYFKNKEKLTLLSSIEKGIKGTSVWKKRKEEYPNIYSRAIRRKNSKQITVQERAKMGKVRQYDQRYEDAVEDLFDLITLLKSQNEFDHNHFVHELADNLTIENVAKYLKEKDERFKNVDIDVIMNGLEHCDAWKNPKIDI